MMYTFMRHIHQKNIFISIVLSQNEFSGFLKKMILYSFSLQIRIFNKLMMRFSHDFEKIYKPAVSHIQDIHVLP